MKCAWKELLSILPTRLRPEVDKLGKDNLLDLRLRLGLPAQLVLLSDIKTIGPPVTRDELHYVVNAASQYSPWAASTAARGYITAPGGHRVGLCGVCSVRDGEIVGIREVRSLCIRVARDIPGVADGINGEGNILILGPPGSGKTTFLRDLIRRRAAVEQIAVVDERGELFPEELIGPGQGIDVMTGCSKQEGLDMVLRTMGPQRIALDEITSENDCMALIRAGWCGVSIYATAHARDEEDLYRRPVYKPLAECGLFTRIVVLGPDKSIKSERRRKWS